MSVHKLHSGWCHTPAVGVTYGPEACPQEEPKLVLPTEVLPT